MLTTKRIANMLIVSEETVRRWIRQGDLKSEQNSRKNGNCVLEKDFIDFLSTRPKYLEIYSVYKKLYKEDCEPHLIKMANRLKDIEAQIKALEMERDQLRKSIEDWR